MCEGGLREGETGGRGRVGDGMKLGLTIFFHINLCKRLIFIIFAKFLKPRRVIVRVN